MHARFWCKRLMAKGVPIRRAADTSEIESHRGRLGPKPGGKRMATLGAVYSVDPFVRSAEEVVESLFRQPGTPQKFVINRYRSPDQNLRTTFNKIIERAGYAPGLVYFKTYEPAEKPN